MTKNEEDEMISQKDTDEYNKLIRILFQPYKTIRDAVHGDIKITTMEKNIIDTKACQRLRYLKQLGTSFLVYPCANHTRFEHALGTVFMSNKIIEIINNNTYANVKVEPYDKLIIRLCALLHDLCNLPFGHTLEDEGKLFKSQWKDVQRLNMYLGDDTDIGQAIRNNETLNELNDLGYKEFDPQNVTKDLRETISAIENKTPEELPKPYMADIVGNTLCSDLLDYIRRDFYYTGLRGDYDDRFLSYLYIGKINKGKKEKDRLILRLARPSTGRIRKDVLSETLHLLRMRYALAEKVYFHHAKISSSAMLISAVNDAIQNDMQLDDIYQLGDEAFLAKMLNSGTDIAKLLIGKLMGRQLYKPVYGLKYSEDGLDATEARKKKNLIENLWEKPENRWKIERDLETKNFVTPGSIVLYCPGGDMGSKAVRALVNIGNDEIGPLDEVLPHRVKEEVRTSITQKHLELWSMYVFVDPNLENKVKRDIYGDCNEIFDLHNEITDCEEYSKTNWLPYHERLEEKRAKEFNTNRLRAEEVELIVNEISHLTKNTGLIDYKNYCDKAKQHISSKNS